MAYVTANYCSLLSIENCNFFTLTFVAFFTDSKKKDIEYNSIYKKRLRAYLFNIVPLLRRKSDRTPIDDPFLFNTDRNDSSRSDHETDKI